MAFKESLFAKEPAVSFPRSHALTITFNLSNGEILYVYTVPFVQGLLLSLRSERVYIVYMATMFSVGGIMAVVMIKHDKRRKRLSNI